MKTVDVGDTLQEGFEIAPPPPLGADGAPQLGAMRRIVPVPPSLCEAGPCRYYHRFAVQTDSENPRAFAIPPGVDGDLPGVTKVDGRVVYQPPASFHTQIEHHCYPSQGIEMDLGAAPVLECNRWDPAPRTAPSVRGEAFWRSAAGAVHLRLVKEWEDARRAESAADAEVDAAIAAAVGAYADRP